jgi:hypothetical protein
LAEQQERGAAVLVLDGRKNGPCSATTVERGRRTASE